MLILIAGPYRSGTNDDPTLMQQNLNNLESVALPLFRKGHIPMIGEWVALPVIHLAGSAKLVMKPGEKFNILLPGDFLKKVTQFFVCKALLKVLTKM